MDRLKEIINELAEIRKGCVDDVLFAKSVEIYLMELTEKNKNNRTAMMGERGESNLASFKQIQFLKRLGFNGKTDGITKQEASKLIEEYTNKKKIGEKNENFEEYAY